MKKEDLEKIIERDGKTFRATRNLTSNNVGKETHKKMKDDKRFAILKTCKNKVCKAKYKNEIEAYDKKIKDKKVK